MTTAVSAASLDVRLDAIRAEYLGRDPPAFGHDCRKLYSFGEDYVELNNGSFGACPRNVTAVLQCYIDEAERRPDFWFRFDFKRYLNKARLRVAELVGCNVDDLVLISNATTGVNAILRGLQPHWSQSGRDAILIFDTIYGACRKTVQYIVDSNPTLQLQIVTVTVKYPTSHIDYLHKIEEAIARAQMDGLRIRIAILDAISSLPGVVVPWEEAVALFRKHGILSLVDGAHAVGQIGFNLQRSDPDFFVSNCHKWLSAHRGCALLYTSKRNQHLVPGLPTSHYYTRAAEGKAVGPPLIPTDAPSQYVAMWESLGTQDVSNFVSLSAALDFREWIGGETAIRNYTHALAQRGGKIVTDTLGPGSVVMENSQSGSAELLTASMVNVSIPIDWSKVDEQSYPSPAYVALQLQDIVSEDRETFIPFYVHNEKIWARISAQIWLEDSDFVWAANRIKNMLARLDLACR